MTTRYNLRSRSTISAPKRLENEVFLPGSNNGYTAGRAIDMGADIGGMVERYDNQPYDLSLQPDVDDEYHVDSEPENVQELHQAIRGHGSEEDEEEFSEGEETEVDDDAYSVYSEEDDDYTESEEEDIEEYDSQEITIAPDQWAQLRRIDTQEEGWVHRVAVALEQGEELPPAKRRRIDTQEEKGPHVSSDSDSEWLPEDEEDDDYDEDQYAPIYPETVEEANENLIDEYWRPTFSENLDVDVAIIQAPVNVNDPMGWTKGMAFIQTKKTDEENLLDNVVMIWRGESRYDETDGTQMKCYFFYQDISPFIYDYWNHDSKTHIDSDWIPSSSLQWVVPMNNDDHEFLIEASSWTPNDVFDRELDPSDYGEWENEYLDTDNNTPPRQPKTLTSEDMELLDAYCGYNDGYISEDSTPDSIS